MRRATLLAVVALPLLASFGCRERPVPRPPGAAIGDIEDGAEAIDAYGCASCHSIPGIEDADSYVGPPLHSWSQRSFVAGTLPNNAKNLVRWLRDPESIRPGTGMPDLGIPEADAADIAAYLLSLE